MGEETSGEGTVETGMMARMRRIWARWGPLATRFSHHGSVLLSVLLLGVIALELSKVDLAAAFAPRALPLLFWLAFFLFFMGSPFIEWLILRRLWHAPFSGFWAILRKMVYNEMLISYLGDAYLFAWIRRELPHVKAPFAVVKDMAIVSAFMGSVVTLLAIAVAWPLFPQIDEKGLGTSVMLGLSVPLASGGAIALFRNRLLSLPRGEIVWIGWACGIRVVGQNIAAIVMWWSLLPQVPLASWVVLAAIRMVSSRLPLVPNKDLAFAAVTVALFGPAGGIGPMIVMITTFVLAANILVAIGVSLASWGQAISRRRRLSAA